MTIPCTTAVTFSAAILLMTCAGCLDTSPRDASSRAAGGSAAPTPAATSATTRSPDLTADSLNAFERGLKKEIEAVRAAQERSRGAAMSAEERGAAIQATFETATIPQGAAAAGLPVAQYRELRKTIHEILRTLDVQDKIEGPLSMDLSRADEATRQRLARDPLADLPPASAAALRAHMDRLVPIWIEYVRLTAVAG